MARLRDGIINVAPGRTVTVAVVFPLDPRKDAYARCGSRDGALFLAAATVEQMAAHYRGLVADGDYEVNE